MAHSTVVISAAARTRQSKERAHRIRVWIAGLSALVFCLAVGIYGFDYYTLPRELRPFSDKHELLRPSGLIGINLGILGTVLFLIIFLYAFRKIIPALGRFGTAKHWMDFHIICGVSAPIIIACHASFKFNNIAGVAFWIMLAVAFSGIAGRYLYAQIPQSLNAAKTSFQELESSEDQLADALRRQSIFTAENLARIFTMPSAEQIRKSAVLVTLGRMILLDLRRPFQIAALRRQASGFGQLVRSFGGLFSTGNPDVERIVRLVRQKASLSKRILFLDQAERIFHLWHVVHRPFSYAFAVLAVFHIVNSIRLGYF
jgi:TRAP-type C4-dicarboxylate transport system permease small subunit